MSRLSHRLANIQFGSWTYDGTKLDLDEAAGGLDLSEYMINGEWNLYRM